MQGKDGPAPWADHGHMKNALRILAACALAGAASAPAFAADVDNGQKLSRQWCAACHVVASDQKQASADVPTFGDIARRKKDPKALVLFLTQPHGQMPDMTLSQPEIADIVAHIFTLGPNPIAPERRAEPPSNGLSGAIVPQK